MLAPFVEAVRSTSQPCTFLLVVPVAAGLVVARARWSAVAAAAAAAIVGGWLVASNRIVLDGAWLRASGLFAAAGLVAAATPHGWRWLERFAAGPAAVAGSTTLLATMWWRPCVGDELGQILTAGQHGGADLLRQLLPMVGYMLGAVMPVLAIALLIRAVEPASRWTDRLARVGAFVGFLVGGALALGRHDDVVVTLTRWTLE